MVFVTLSEDFPSESVAVVMCGCKAVVFDV